MPWGLILDLGPKVGEYEVHHLWIPRRWCTDALNIGVKIRMLCCALSFFTLHDVHEDVYLCFNIHNNIYRISCWYRLWSLWLGASAGKATIDMVVFETCPIGLRDDWGDARIHLWNGGNRTGTRRSPWILCHSRHPWRLSGASSWIWYKIFHIQKVVRLHYCSLTHTKNGKGNTAMRNLGTKVHPDWFWY